MEKECIHATIDWSIIESAQAFINKHGETYSVPSYLFLVIQQYGLKVYESAPSCEAAEELLTDAIRNAKEMFLEE